MISKPMPSLTQLSDSDADEWILDTNQMLFMMQHNNAIESAFRAEDMEYFRMLSASKEFQLLFVDMSFDEAFDRYECMLEGQRPPDKSRWLVKASPC